MEVTYNCWHGCIKKSEGCLNCYVYRYDKLAEKDSSKVYKTQSFNLPIRKKRNGEYKYPSGTTFYLCFSSDFFLKEADDWRDEVLEMIKERKDCEFYCLTKRPERILECIPDVETYDNLTIHCTMENQKRFDERMPIYMSLPLRSKGIMMEPLLEDIDMKKYLSEKIDIVSIGGETGKGARALNFDWVKHIKTQCERVGIKFVFRQTGNYLIVNNKKYYIPRKYQFSQAQKAFNNESD